MKRFEEHAEQQGHIAILEKKIPWLVRVFLHFPSPTLPSPVPTNPCCPALCPPPSLQRYEQARMQFKSAKEHKKNIDRAFKQSQREIAPSLFA